MEHFFDGKFGLERETLRVTGEGRLAQSPHPLMSPYLDRDFCENQLELITPVCESIDELMETLERIDESARTALREADEYLWMYSNPPYFASEDEIPVAMYTGELAYKTEYRRYLEKQYGKRLMLYSGIHFNFSFGENALKKYCHSSNCKNKLYFKLSKLAFRYSWLIVLLTAASPVYDLSLDGGSAGGDGFCGYASMRGGDRGYWNRFIPILDYGSLESYVESVGKYIQNGSLSAEGELYLPIRLKPHGQNTLRSLIENGVDHIELRMFDINPLSPQGIFREDIEFAHYFMLYLCCLPDFDFTPELQSIAVYNYRAAARYDMYKMETNGYRAYDAALGILDDMAEYFKGCKSVEDNILYQKRKITENKRYCVTIKDRFGKDYNSKMLRHIKEGHKI